jgi:guanine deaminase
VFLGTVCHTPRIGAVEVLKQQLMVAGASGTITYLGPPDTAQAAAALQAQSLTQQHVRALTPKQLLLPGFIDTHCHAPQYQFTGVGTDLPLFEWLHT